jgi:hypothetical protein
MLDVPSAIDALDHFAVELQYELQHAVRRRMLRPEIDGEMARRSFGHGGTGRLMAPRRLSRRPISPAYAGNG